MAKQRKPIENLVKKLSQEKQQEDDMVELRLYHDGSYSITRYNENNPIDVDVLSVGSTEQLEDISRAK